MIRDFSDAAEILASERGGFTLWLGAGAAKALCPSMPTWNELTRALARGLHDAPDENAEFSQQLEQLACAIGHEQFRARLRKAIVETIVTADLDATALKHQAIIGTRAGAIVSFNVELASSVPFCTAPLPGAFVPRPYLRTRDRLPINLMAEGGLVSKPVFFPHGLLDIYGECVITRSEYLEHGMSMAATTAVNLCLGGDLVILGMSLADEYLREAILQNRRSIDEIFWFADRFSHPEWARVARVHCIQVKHERVWGGLAEAFLKNDVHSEIKKLVEHGDLGGRATRGIKKVREFVADIPQRLEALAADYASGKHFRPSDLQRFAAQCVSLGLPVPAAVRDDPRSSETPRRARGIP